MKILSIEKGSGLFRVDEKDDWKPIDEIDKEQLLKLLDLFLSEDVDLDPIEDQNLSNQAQRIIYNSIYEKLNALKDSKGKFKDESERTYLEAIKKYSQA
ncbi:MAG: hypothetical protein IH855_01615 [Bacteroidetes bacterium]|nr:hypothetical protein [Bacteroidota bacterium]